MVEAHRPSSAPILVGREREQALLRQALAAALAGRGSLVLIGGEAGIGKTALAEWLLAEAEACGALALVGRCYDLAETPPYGPWAEALGRGPDDPDLPPLPAALLPAGRDSETPSDRTAIVARARAHLAGLAGRQGLVLLLEDLHWADLASLDLFRLVARDLADRSLLLIATFRADEVARQHPLYALLPTLLREARPGRLDLRPLLPDDLQALVRGRYALAPHDEARLVAYLAMRSEGNPLFAGELLRALEEGRTLRPGAAGWTLGDLDAVGLPAPLRQVLDARADRLGEGPRHLLAVAAVIGQEVPLALWATVAGTDEGALLDAVERATEAHILVETPDWNLRFTHALVREALYLGLALPRRRALHRAAGEALLASPHPDPDAVADHFRRASDPRAIEWLARASFRAEVAGALFTAAERVTVAERLLRDDPTRAGQRGWLLYRLGWLVRLGEPERGLAYQEQAEHLAEVAGNPALALLARAERGFARFQLGAFGAAEADLIAALDARDRLSLEAWETGLADGALAVPLSRGRDPGKTFASLLETRRDSLALIRARLGRYAESLALGEARLPADAATGDVRDLASERYGSPGLLGNLFLAMGHTYAALGRPEEALALFRQTARSGDLIHNHLVAATALGDALLYVALPYRADRVDERRELAAAMIAEYRRSTQLGVGTLSPAALRHALDLVEGDWSAAERGALALRDAPLTRPWWPGEARVTLGTLARRRGDRAAARQQVRDHLPEGPSTAPGRLLFPPTLALLRLAADLALDAGDLCEARAWLMCHDHWLAWSGTALWRAEGALGWAAYHRVAGDLAHARQHAERALARATEPRQPLALLAAHRLVGELGIAAGALASATADLDTALALAEACAAPYERALTLLALAELYAAADEHERARAALDEARAFLRPVEARVALARASALDSHLTEAGPTAIVPTAAPAQGYPAGLTAREVEVMGLIARGHTNQEIASTLHVSRHTVIHHVTHILNKTGCPNRAAIVAYAHRHSLA